MSLEQCLQDFHILLCYQLVNEGGNLRILDHLWDQFARSKHLLREYYDCRNVAFQKSLPLDLHPARIEHRYSILPRSHPSMLSQLFGHLERKQEPAPAKLDTLCAEQLTGRCKSSELPSRLRLAIHLFDAYSYTQHLNSTVSWVWQRKKGLSSMCGKIPPCASPKPPIQQLCIETLD